jgi:hypothetical protein
LNYHLIKYLPTLLAFGYVLFRMGNDPYTLKAAQKQLGLQSSLDRSQAIGLIGGVLIALALFVVIDPEARILFMFIDSVGVDLFVTVWALALRHYMTVSVALVSISMLQVIYRFGPLPRFWPYPEVVRSSPSFLAYAITFPVGVLLCFCICVNDVLTH